MKKGCWLATSMALVIALALWNPVSAGGLPEDGPDQDNGRRVGLVSTAVECLVVRAGTLSSVSATMRLQWEGQVEEAFLMLSVAGSQGGHSIYVNGRRVGSAPVRPGGSLCRPESPARVLGATDTIPIPTEVLAKGENVITLTNDANVNDGWTAANVHLEIHGILTGPPVGALRTTMATPEAPPPTTSPLAPLKATAIYSTSGITLTSSYDGWDHYVQYHAPTDVNNVPLVVAIHGMGGDSQDMMDLLSTAVQNYTWALVAPDMHSMAIPNSGADALAWVGAQHDVVETIEYMQSTFSIDPSRIYIVGESMGGQTTTLMAAKYPDIFAAAAEWMGFTNVADWHTELSAYEAEGHNFWNLRERTERQMSPDPGEYLTPTQAPFEYGRRSSMMMPLNMLRVPLKIWHDECDLVVDLHHSEDLANVINSVKPSTVDLETVVDACPADPTIPPYGHCYEPDPVELLDTLDGYTLSSNPPISLTIRTDESKPYYWLNVAQTGGDHWSEVETAYSLAGKTVTATISDTQPLTLALNLGSTPIMGPGGVNRPGMGLPATTYLVKGGSNSYLHNYTSGYLTTTLLTVGQFTLTISAIAAEVSANPNVVSAWQTATSTITAVVQDYLGNPIPDDTIIPFSTTEGTFANESSTYTTTVTGGQVTTTLTLAAVAADLAEITTSVESVTDSTSVNIIHPALEVAITPSQTTIYSEQVVTYAYQITNTGDTTLTGIILVDDNSTPGDSGDDITVCESITLAAGATASCSRSMTLTQTTTNTVTVTGQDLLGHDVTGSDSATVNVISPAIEVTIRPDQTTIRSGQAVTYTYQISNIGDTTLTGVILVDDNGTWVDSSDDITVCESITLAAGATASCSRSMTLTQTTTNTVTVTGQDLLGHDVTGSDSATVNVISPAIEVTIRPDQTTIRSGQAVTYTYQISNIGDTTLTGVILVDDNGTWVDSSDDITVCESITLAAGATASCSRNVTLTQTTTNTATVTGQDPLGHNVTGSDWAKVSVTCPAPDGKIYLPIVTRNRDSLARSIHQTRYHIHHRGEF